MRVADVEHAEIPRDHSARYAARQRAAVDVGGVERHDVGDDHARGADDAGVDDGKRVGEQAARLNRVGVGGFHQIERRVAHVHRHGVRGDVVHALVGIVAGLAGILAPGGVGQGDARRDVRIHPRGKADRRCAAHVELRERPLWICPARRRRRRVGDVEVHFAYVGEAGGQGVADDEVVGRPVAGVGEHDAVGDEVARAERVARRLDALLQDNARLVYGDRHLVARCDAGIVGERDDVGDHVSGDRVAHIVDDDRRHGDDALFSGGDAVVGDGEHVPRVRDIAARRGYRIQS